MIERFTGSKAVKSDSKLPKRSKSTYTSISLPELKGECFIVFDYSSGVLIGLQETMMPAQFSVQVFSISCGIRGCNVKIMFKVTFIRAGQNLWGIFENI